MNFLLPNYIWPIFPLLSCESASRDPQGHATNKICLVLSAAQLINTLKKCGGFSAGHHPGAGDGGTGGGSGGGGGAAGGRKHAQVDLKLTKTDSGSPALLFRIEQGQKFTLTIPCRVVQDDSQVVRLPSSDLQPGMCEIAFPELDRLRSTLEKYQRLGIDTVKIDVRRQQQQAGIGLQAVTSNVSSGVEVETAFQFPVAGSSGGGAVAESGATVVMKLKNLFPGIHDEV